MPEWVDHRGAGVAGGEVIVPGIYAVLLEHEREHSPRPDPRWRFTPAAREGKPCPPQYLIHSKTLPRLEAGKSVPLPSWWWHADPPADAVAALQRLQREHRGIVWVVHSDDTVQVEHLR